LIDYSAFSNTEVTGGTGNVDSSQTGQMNNLSTSQVSIAGTEDLGGGLKASFVINTGITGTASTSFGDRDRFLALEGGFGSVRIGRFAPDAAKNFHAQSAAVSVNQGSLYGLTSVGSTSSARFGNLTGGNFERNDNNVEYKSPSFGGFTVSANYGTSKSDVLTEVGEQEATQSGLGLAYANGPLSISAGLNTRDANREAAAAVNSTTSNLATSAVTDRKIKADLNWIGASYDLGVAKVYATNVSRKDKTTANTGVQTTNADINVTALGVSVPVSAYTFNATVYTGKDKVGAASTDDTKLSGYQLSARYALSKRTSLYALTGENQIKRDGTTGTARKETLSAVGIVHTF
jgi:predicted porin